MTEKNFIRFHAEIVNGRCPTCEEHTMLVGITPEVYRCINCGADLQQHVNGVISYIPRLSGNALMSELNKFITACFTNAKFISYNRSYSLGFSFSNFPSCCAS